MIPPYHAGYVLDASVIVKWFTRQEEADREAAQALRAAYARGRFRLAIPDLCLIEIANALRFSPKAAEADVAEAIEAINAVALDVVGTDAALLKRANAIAWGYGLTVYDAIYVALAEQRTYPVITADEALLKKMRGHSIVLSLKSIDFRHAVAE